jgi:hypothetical protein
VPVVPVVLMVGWWVERGEEREEEVRGTDRAQRSSNFSRSSPCPQESPFTPSKCGTCRAERYASESTLSVWAEMACVGRNSV